MKQSNIFSTVTLFRQLGLLEYEVNQVKNYKNSQITFTETTIAIPRDPAVLQLTEAYIELMHLGFPDSIFLLGYPEIRLGFP